jgi:hypothetical protein
MDNLKPLVNNKDLWDSFLKYLDSEIELSRTGLEQAKDDTYQGYQGEIRILRRLKKLREKVNG